MKSPEPAVVFDKRRRTRAGQRLKWCSDTDDAAPVYASYRLYLGEQLGGFWSRNSASYIGTSRYCCSGKCSR